MEFSDLWELKATCAYITRNNYTRVTLQFPDDMLHDSPLVADALQTELTAAGSEAKVRPLRRSNQLRQFRMKDTLRLATLIVCDCAEVLLLLSLGPPSSLLLLLLLLLLPQVYVLADTSYNPLSVDEVAAAHVNADCVVSGFSSAPAGFGLLGSLPPGSQPAASCLFNYDHAYRSACSCMCLWAELSWLSCF
jgi:diphthamide biosynthesis protein 2